MSLNVQDIIIHSISPFLSLPDIARLAYVSTKFARIRNLLFRKVTTVVVPEILPQKSLNRSLVAEFILKLVVVCPNVNNITLLDEMDLHSDAVIKALEKLPIKALDYGNAAYSYFYRSNEDSTALIRYKPKWPLTRESTYDANRFLKSD